MFRCRKYRYAAGGLVFFLVALGPTLPLYGAEWSSDIGVQLVEEYNNNIFFTSTNQKDDFVTLAIPRINILRRSLKTRLRLESLLEGEIYSKLSDLNAVNNTSRVSLDSSWTQRISTNISGWFRKDQTLDTELEEFGTQTERRDRYRYGGDVNGSIAFSERFLLRLDGVFRSSLFPVGPYPDSHIATLRVNPSWAMSPRDSIGIQLMMDYADYLVIDVDYPTTQALLNWEREFERYEASLGVGAGYRWTWMKGEDRETDLLDEGIVFNVSLKTEWTERLSSMLSSGREIYYSVDARVIERTMIRVTGKYRMSETCDISCRVGYDLTSETGLGEEKNKYFSVDPFFSWQAIKDVFLVLGGSYQHLEKETRSLISSYNRYRITVMVDWRRPRFLTNE